MKPQPQSRSFEVELKWDLPSFWYDIPEAFMIWCEEQDIEQSLPIGTTWQEIQNSKIY